MSRTGAIDAFETKCGWCAVDDDGLRIQGSAFGYLRDLYRGYWRRGSRLQRLVFLGMVVGLAVGVAGFSLAGVSVPVLVALGLAYLGIAAYQRVIRGVTTDRWIPLSEIEEVLAVRSSEGLTRPRLVVRYTVAGRRRRPYVTLPSLYYPGGEETFDRAVSIMESRGVPIEEA